MNHLDHAFKWAQQYDFTPEELEYATILQLKILDAKCQMSPQDQELFSHVYQGIRYKKLSPFKLLVHELIDRATGDTLCAKPTHQKTIHLQRQEHEAHMQRPLMKAYKQMVRERLKVS